MSVILDDRAEGAARDHLRYLEAVAEDMAHDPSEPSHYRELVNGIRDLTILLDGNWSPGMDGPFGDLTLADAARRASGVVHLT